MRHKTVGAPRGAPFFVEFHDYLWKASLIGKDRSGVSPYLHVKNHAE